MSRAVPPLPVLAANRRFPLSKFLWRHSDDFHYRNPGKVPVRAPFFSIVTSLLHLQELFLFLCPLPRVCSAPILTEIYEPLFFFRLPSVFSSKCVGWGRVFFQFRVPTIRNPDAFLLERRQFFSVFFSHPFLPFGTAPKVVPGVEEV